VEYIVIELYRKATRAIYRSVPNTILVKNPNARETFGNLGVNTVTVLKLVLKNRV
jgi:hypothetical protein